MAKRSNYRYEVYIGDSEEPVFIAPTHDEAADWFQAAEDRQVRLFGHDFGGDAYIREVVR